MYLFDGKNVILRPKSGLVFQLMPWLAAFCLGPTPVSKEVLISNLSEDQRKELIDLAMAWAKSPEARGLPGYLGPS